MKKEKPLHNKYSTKEFNFFRNDLMNRLFKEKTGLEVLWDTFGYSEMEKKENNIVYKKFKEFVGLE